MQENLHKIVCENGPRKLIGIQDTILKNVFFCSQFLVNPEITGNATSEFKKCGVFTFSSLRIWKLLEMRHQNIKNVGFLLSVPCESGNYWKCDISACVTCPQGYYQPQWGQTSCWPCPYNTTTDTAGSTSPLDCKSK